MAAMFPEGPPGETQSQRFDRDGFIVFVTETKMSLQHLTKAVEELAARVAESASSFGRRLSELADRFDADADDLRGSMAGLNELRNNQVDIIRRVVELEGKQVKNEARLTEGENWRIQEKTWLAAISLFGGLTGSVGGFFLTRLFK